MSFVNEYLGAGRAAVNPIRQRVKANVPAVVLTLLGIIQAFAVDLLWSFVVADSEIYQLSLPALITWLQILSLVAGMLMIWLIYAMNVSRFVWVPTMSEFVTPFWVGFLQVLSIHCLKFDNPGAWFISFALIIATMNWIAHSTMKRARLEPDNAEFFNSRGTASASDFYPVFAVIGTMLATGFGFLLIGVNQWVLLITLVFGVGGYCVWQTYKLRVWWQQSVLEAEA